MYNEVKKCFFHEKFVKLTQILLSGWHQNMASKIGFKFFPREKIEARFWCHPAEQNTVNFTKNCQFAFCNTKDTCFYAKIATSRKNSFLKCILCEFTEKVVIMIDNAFGTRIVKYSTLYDNRIDDFTKFLSKMCGSKLILSFPHCRCENYNVRHLVCKFKQEYLRSCTSFYEDVCHFHHQETFWQFIEIVI